MKIQEYTVVACPDCKNVKIVQDIPEKTTCGRCRKAFSFKKARKFHTTNDIEEGRFVRSKVQARINNVEDEFDEIAEELMDYDYTDRDSDTPLDNFVDDRESSSESTSKSQKQIAQDALDETESESEFIEYCVDRQVPEEKADEFFTEFKRTGEIFVTPTGGFTVL